MNTPFRIILALAYMLPTQGVENRSADEKDARQIVAHAIAAIGGKDNVVKLKAASWNTQSWIFREDGTIRFHSKTIVQWPDKCYSDSGDSQQAFDGKIGWGVAFSRFSDIDLKKNPSVIACNRVNWMSKLLPVQELSFGSKTIGTINVDGKTLKGIQVACENHPVRFFFDVETKLLVKTEYKHTEYRGPGKMEAVRFECQYSDYRAMNGVKFAHRFAYKRDGIPSGLDQISDFRILENVDAKLFARPPGVDNIIR